MANNGPMPEYQFRITLRTPIGNQEHNLTPVQAYNFLTNDFNLPLDRKIENNDPIRQPTIRVLHNDNYILSLEPIIPMVYKAENPNSKFYRNVDSVEWDREIPSDPINIFRYIAEVDKQKGGNFIEQFLEEYTARKQAGEEVYNPFSPSSNNKNFKSMSRLRKNHLILQLPPTWESQFSAVSAGAPYARWSGATPIVNDRRRTRKTRSRKTRKIRR